jgi:peptide/nickel transport system substrate-binding protein
VHGPQAPGSGSYRLTQGEPEQRLVLEPRLDHPDFLGKQRPLTLDLRWMPDATTRLLALRHGTVQASLNNLPADLLRPAERMTVRHRPGANLEYVAFNCASPMLADARIRRALALATDRTGMVKGLLGGMGRPATAFYPPELPWGVDASQDLGLTDDLQANLRAAEALLDAGGRPRGADGLRFRLRLTTTAEVSARMKALALQAQWRKVGVELDLVTREFGTLLSEVMGSKFEVVSLRWIGVTDPQMLMDTFHSTKAPPAGFNRGRFQDREIDRLLEQAQVAPDPASRWALLRAVQVKLVQASPYVFLYWPDQVAALAPGLAVDLNAAGDFSMIWRTQE